MSVAGFAAHVAATSLSCQDLYFIMVTTLRAVQTNFDLRGEEKPQDMNNMIMNDPYKLFSLNNTKIIPSLRRQFTSPFFYLNIPLPPLTLASLLMVQHLEVEVMLWVKLEATSTEYLEGKALDSQ